MRVFTVCAGFSFGVCKCVGCVCVCVYAIVLFSLITRVQPCTPGHSPKLPQHDHSHTGPGGAYSRGYEIAKPVQTEHTRDEDLGILEGELSSVQELGFAFKRASSRLVEMAGSEYLRAHARAHPEARPLPDT